ncbi:MAG: hypothetical protein KatS3mg102_1067 [Planctomycetota bacterium]|nr:MAG: hypothetical protein KatS3mg102_1067 [Planctomycetota bacterium]
MLRHKEHQPVLVTLLPQIDEAQLPQSIEALQDRIERAEREAENKLTLFREGLREWAADWVRQTAKAVAVHQTEHTLRLGRRGVQRLKARIAELLAQLPARVEQELTPEILLTDELSSGQVALVIDRRFEKVLRRLLGALMPLLARAGYSKDRHWLDEQGEGRLELPPDLRSLLDELVAALAEAKVCEAKIRYFDRQLQQRAAERLWEGV